MKNHSKLLIICFLTFLIFNQSLSQDCVPATAQIDLDVNNVKARLLVGGNLWWDGDDFGQYIAPQVLDGEPEVSPIGAGAIWLGGYDSGGNLKTAAQTYGIAFGDTDYWPGPLMESGYTTVEDCANYDRFWQTNSTHINTHIADWNDNGVINGPVPQSILAWPGRGNPHFQNINGFELPNTSQGLAPFVDRNSNGVYEPNDGDHPDINGADQGIWWVFNDAGGVHSESGGIPLQMEIQVLAYAYSSNNKHIDNATFYDYKFINRGLDQLDSAYVGLWMDVGLGCSHDDYFGCDTLNNLVFVYNADSLDGWTNPLDCGGSYYDEIPILGVKILKGVTGFDNGVEVDRGMSSFIYYNNGGVQPPPPPGTEDPSLAPEYYNYLTGSWRNGLGITHGGSGYSPAGEYTNYVFTDPPNDINGWSMCSEDLSAGDRRIVIGSGPFQIDPGGVNHLSFAVLFVEDVPHPCPDISPLLEAADVAQDLFDGLISSTEELADTPANIQFRPNPMSNEAELIFNELENSVRQVAIFSIDGKLMRVYNSGFGKSLVIEKGQLGGGMYFYKIVTDDFKVYSGKFVVQ